MYTIEKGIPIPPKHKREKGKLTYPYDDMEIGDSVLIPDKRQGTLQSSIRQAHFRTGYMFTMRTVKGGVRVWRILP